MFVCTENSLVAPRYCLSSWPNYSTVWPYVCHRWGGWFLVLLSRLWDERALLDGL